MQRVLLNRGLDCRTGIQRYIRREQRETVWTELIAKGKKGLHRVRLIDMWETPIRDRVQETKELRIQGKVSQGTWILAMLQSSWSIKQIDLFN